MKEYKGTIENWREIPCGNGIGYTISGTSVDHPEFAGEHMRTSSVLVREGDEIETLNSRYTLTREANVEKLTREQYISQRAALMVREWLEKAPSQPFVEYCGNQTSDGYITKIVPHVIDVWDKEAMMSEWDNLENKIIKLDESIDLWGLNITVNTDPDEYWLKGRIKDLEASSTELTMEHNRDQNHIIGLNRLVGKQKLYIEECVRALNEIIEDANKAIALTGDFTKYEQGYRAAIQKTGAHARVVLSAGLLRGGGYDK